MAFLVRILATRQIKFTDDSYTITQSNHLPDEQFSSQLTAKDKGSYQTDEQPSRQMTAYQTDDKYRDILEYDRLPDR